MNLTAIAGLALASYLAVLAPGIADADTDPVQILNPDGTPATDAAVWHIYAEGDFRREEIAVDEDAKFEPPEFKHGVDIVLIDAPGAALKICGTRIFRMLSDDADPDQIQLTEDSRVWGSVVTPEGEPAPGVEVDMTEFGTNTYSSFRHPPEPWSTTTSDADGRYQFRGIDLGFNAPSGCKVTARAEIEGQMMFGHGQHLSTKPGKEEEHSPPVIVLRPCDSPWGTVVDALTGTPIAGARVRGFISHFGTPGPMTTDEAGAFARSGAEVRGSFDVEAPGYHPGRLDSPEGWRPGDALPEFRIPLRPLVDVDGVLVDPHTEGVPAIHLELGYEITDEAGGGWSSIASSRCSSIDFVETAKDGFFVGQLPAGDLVLHIKPNRPTSADGAAYRSSVPQQVPVDPPGGKLELSLPAERVPGILFHLAIPEGIGSSDPDGYWERTAIFANRNGIGSVLQRPESFAEVESWGDPIELRIVLQRAGQGAVLLEETFEARPELWPVEIDVVALREALRKQEAE